MKAKPFIRLRGTLESLMKNRVYVEGAGRLATGLKRRGGFGFLPRRALSPEHRFLKSYPFTGKTVFDIGGFVGLVALFFARQVGKTGQVVTFEPNPVNFAAILDHIDLNGFDNIQPIKTGVGRQRDTVDFVVDGRLPARGTANPRRQTLFSEAKDVQVFQIEIDSLDSLIQNHNLSQPDFVKIDVEGLEYEVLQGMAETLSRSRPEMLIELHGPADLQVAEFLLERGYRIHQIESDLDLTPDDLDQAGGHLYAH